MECECADCESEATTSCRFCGKSFCQSCMDIAYHGCWKYSGKSEVTEEHVNEGHAEV